MLLILPITFCIMYLYYKEKDQKNALATSIIFFQIILLFLTNILSLLQICKSYTVFLSWCTVLFFYAYLYYKRKENIKDLKEDLISNFSLRKCWTTFLTCTILEKV